MIDLRLGCCLELMADIPDASVDLVLCDLPYATTSCHWDSLIPFEPLWAHYRRLLKPRGAVVLTASQPFTSMLVMSNRDWFKYCWVWEKSRATGHVHAKNKPMKRHEDVVVFSPGSTAHAAMSAKRMTFNPQGLRLKKTPTLRRTGGSSDTVMSKRPSHRDCLQFNECYPDSIIGFASEGATVHATQKPVALMEYLIRTYTDEGDMVLDNCVGSGTTLLACLNSGRNGIGIERDPQIFATAEKRIAAAKQSTPLFA